MKLRGSGAYRLVRIAAGFLILHPTDIRETGVYRLMGDEVSLELFDVDSSSLQPTERVDSIARADIIAHEEPVQILALTVERGGIGLVHGTAEKSLAQVFGQLSETVPLHTFGSPSLTEFWAKFSEFIALEDLPDGTTGRWFLPLLHSRIAAIRDGRRSYAGCRRFSN